MRLSFILDEIKKLGFFSASGFDIGKLLKNFKRQRGSALYDAIDLGIDIILKSSNQLSRLCVRQYCSFIHIIITDGQDKASKISKEKLQDQMYLLQGFKGEQLKGYIMITNEDQNIFKNLTEASGNTYEVCSNNNMKNMLVNINGQIQNRINNQKQKCLVLLTIEMSESMKVINKLNDIENEINSIFNSLKDNGLISLILFNSEPSQLQIINEKQQIQKINHSKRFSGMQSKQMVEMLINSFNKVNNEDDNDLSYEEFKQQQQQQQQQDEEKEKLNNCVIPPLDIRNISQDNNKKESNQNENKLQIENKPNNCQKKEKRKEKKQKVNKLTTCEISKLFTPCLKCLQCLNYIICCQRDRESIFYPQIFSFVMGLIYGIIMLCELKFSNILFKEVEYENGDQMERLVFWNKFGFYEGLVISFFCILFKIISQRQYEYDNYITSLKYFNIIKIVIFGNINITIIVGLFFQLYNKSKLTPDHRKLTLIQITSLASFFILQTIEAQLVRKYIDENQEKPKGIDKLLATINIFGSGFSYITGIILLIVTKQILEPKEQNGELIIRICQAIGIFFIITNITEFTTGILIISYFYQKNFFITFAGLKILFLITNFGLIITYFVLTKVRDNRTTYILEIYCIPTFATISIINWIMIVLHLGYLYKD